MATIEELAAKVAGLEQQMAAITTPPTEYYTSAYSGEEIDAAVKKVSEGLAGGVASFNGRTGAVLPQSGDYNATQIPVSGEPEAETVAAALSNKAPAGFGFGDAVQSIETTSAEESYETYCAKVDTVLDGMPNKTAKLVLAYPPAVYGKAGTTISLLYKGDANYAVLSNIGSADTALCGWRMIRLKKSSSEPSAWQPFEWEHPPMQLGVEYRTSERYNGKPVYTKLVDCGAGPSNTRKTVSANTQNVETPISCTGNFGSGTIPYEWFAGDVSGAQAITCTFNGQAIEIAATADYSGWTVFVIVEYTKTTD